MKLSLGQKIRKLRKERGLNQTDMARILGVHLQTLSRYERGELTPGPEILSVLAEKFNLDANELLKSDESLIKEEGIPYGSAEHTAPMDNITKSIMQILKDLDGNARLDVLRYASDKKQLAELLAERNKRKK